MEDKELQDILITAAQEKRLDAALGDKKKKAAGKDKEKEKEKEKEGGGALSSKKTERAAVPHAAARGLKSKKAGKGKKTVVGSDAGASHTSNLAADGGHDPSEEKDDANLEKKSEKEQDLDMFADEDVDWESDLDIDVILNKKIELDPYLGACYKFGAVPISFIVKNLGGSEISIKDHGMGELGARAFGKVLETNTSLLQVDLTGNSIGAGGRLFCKSMLLNRTITYLNLSNNGLISSGPELATLISENKSLQTLILSKNYLGDKEAVLISEGLRKNLMLRVLDLSHNGIGDIGALSLGQGLNDNGNIVEFDISWNEIRIRGISAFLNIVKDASFLENLNISHNGIGDSVNLIAPFLLKTSVVKLNVAYTRLGDSQFASFLRGIEGNRSLQELDISGNPLTGPSISSIFKILPITKITTIHLKDLRFTKEISLLIEGLKKEGSLQVFE